MLHGPADSIAYRAFEQGSRETQPPLKFGSTVIPCSSGCDVFLGNFRGNYPRRLAPWRKQSNDSSFSYWDHVKVQDYAQHDIDAFIRKIREVKLRDMRAMLAERGVKVKDHEEEIERELDKRLKINYVGHSLGGLTLFLYLIHKKKMQEKHYLNSAILLSPAGFHKESSLNFRLSNWFAAKVLSNFIKCIAFPEPVI